MKSWRGKRYVPTVGVTARYGIHRTTLNRWVKDPAMGFPQPDRIRGRNFWDEDKLDAWDQARAGRDLAGEVAAAQREKLRKMAADRAVKRDAEAT